MRLEDKVVQARFADAFTKAVLNVLYTADRISSATSAALKPYGLSKEQYNVLRILRGQHPRPCTLQLVSERMLSQSSNATRLVDKLKQKGLVQRQLCASNRRKVDLLITPRGLDLLTTLDPIVKASNERFRLITDEEAETLNRILDTMHS